MAFRKCSNEIKCAPNGTDADSPIQNWSSEQTDGPDFASLAWYIGNANNPFFPDIPTNGIIDPCDSPISQADADLCSNGGTVVHNTPDPPGGPPVQFFFSASQTCDYICPDGSIYTFFLPAGSFVSSNNQATADAQALAYACAQAASTHMCLSPITLGLSGMSPFGCFGAPFSGSVSVSRGTGPFLFAVVSGTLPPGIALTQNGGRTAFFSGTPSAVGIYPFTLAVSDSAGHVSSRNYSINVLGITNPDLPDGFIGTAYSEQFIGGGGTPPFNMQVLLGTLPDGLSMDSSGLVTGTPTTSETSAFTVGISDASGNVCEVDCSITVSGCLVDWTQLVWDTVTFFSQGNGHAFGSALTNKWSFDVLGQNLFPLNGADSTATIHGSMLYTGGACTCQVDINLTTIVGRGSCNFNIIQDGNPILDISYDPTLAINPLGLVPGHNIRTFNISAGVNSSLVIGAVGVIARGPGNVGGVAPGWIAMDFTLG